METEMRAAAKELEFERAAALRDEIQQIRLRVLDEDQSAIIARAADLRVPFLLLHGARDQLIYPGGSQRFFARATAPERAYCLYPGMYHEIFNEVDKEMVFQDIESWLTERTEAHLTGWNPPP